MRTLATMLSGNRLIKLSRKICGEAIMSDPAPSRLPCLYVSIKRLSSCLKGEMCHLLVKIIRRPLSKPGKCWEVSRQVGAAGAGWDIRS